MPKDRLLQLLAFERPILSPCRTLMLLTLSC